MLGKLTHKLTISTAKSFLKDNTSELNIGKSLISIISGAYILQSGIRKLRKIPFLGTQEIFLGGLLLYNGATGIKNNLIRSPRKISEIRKNQIQGNDPDCDVPAFV